jgi:hypothetical protein
MSKARLLNQEGILKHLMPPPQARHVMIHILSNPTSMEIQLFKGFFVRSKREFRSEARTVRSGSTLRRNP